MTSIMWPSAVEHDAAWMSTLLDRALPKGVVLGWPDPPGLLDSTYWTIDEEEFLNLIRWWDFTDKTTYVAQRRDCDKSARQLWATFGYRLGINSVGLVWDYSAGHAYNFVAFTDGSFRYFEPQNDQYVQLGSGLYILEKGRLDI